jgi:hypothetical protein
MPMTFSPEEITGMMKAIKGTGFYDPSQYSKALEAVKNWVANKPGQGADIPISAAKGAAPAVGAGSLMGLLPLIGAGALATGAWAYPAYRLGKELGWRIEEKKAGRSLRSSAADQITQDQLIQAIKKRRSKKIK